MSNKMVEICNRIEKENRELGGETQTYIGEPLGKVMEGLEGQKQKLEKLPWETARTRYDMQHRYHEANLRGTYQESAEAICAHSGASLTIVGEELPGLATTAQEKINEAMAAVSALQEAVGRVGVQHEAIAANIKTYRDIVA